MRILVAEDEQDIRRTYSVALEDRGHEVTLTSDGQECLEVYRQQLEEYNQQQQQDKSPHQNQKTPSSSPFDVVILDYKMPKKDGLQAAKEILDINHEQRIIFASAYVKETLEESVKKLKRVVELMQKPFSISALIDIAENKEAYQGLKQLMAGIKGMEEKEEGKEEKDFEPTPEQIRDIFEGLRKIQKYRY